MTIRSIRKAFLLFFILLSVWFVVAWVHFLNTPLVNDDKGVVYTVKAGRSANAVINDLYHQGILTHPFFMKWLLRFQGDTRQLKAGEYLFAKGATPSVVLKQMMTGTGLVYYPFTIVPGWDFQDIRQALSQEKKLHHSIEHLSDQEVMHRLGWPTLHPEGQFFPDTYFYTADASDVTVLRRAFQLMQVTLHATWASRAPQLPYRTPYEALIAASLIEKEAYFGDERPMISGVLVNRLNKSMLLQIDATVIYGMGARFTGSLHKEDLKENTIYNTYIHKGLPPTPIAIPSLDSLKAALHPAQHDYFYYVARGDGGHQFSENYAQHELAVTKANHVHAAYFNAEVFRQHIIKFVFGNSASV